MNCEFQKRHPTSLPFHRQTQSTPPKDKSMCHSARLLLQVTFLFGAMIEKRITDNWEAICSKMGYPPIDRPGRRTIFDFAFQVDNQVVGIDVKTKDLDSARYSDGGICAVGNLLKYLANDKGVFLIAEFGMRLIGIENWLNSMTFLSTCRSLIIGELAKMQ